VIPRRSSALAWSPARWKHYRSGILPYRRDLTLLFIIACCSRLIWAFLIPPWQVPDEAAHFTYVAHIVEQGELPYTRQTAELPLYSQEVIESLKNGLYFATSSGGSPIPPPLTVMPAGYDYAIARDYYAPGMERRSAGGATATPYSAGSYLLEVPAYWLFRDMPILSRLYAVRCVIAVVGALSCLFAYAIGTTLGGDREWGRTLGLMLAWFPQYTFMSAGMNNDAASILCATALIWLIIILLQRQRLSLALALAMGFCAAVGAIVKPTTVPIALVSGVVVLWQLVREKRQTGIPLSHRARLLLIYTLGAALIIGPELLLRRYLGTRATAAAVAEVDSSLSLHGFSYPLAEYLHAKTAAGSFYLQWFFLKTGWGLFGTLDVPLGEETYAVIGLISIVGITAALVAALTNGAVRWKLALPLALIAAQVGFVFLGMDYYLSYATTGTPLGIQGRYLFPALVPFLYLLLSGWYYLSHSHRYTLRLASIGALALQVTSLIAVVGHYYGLGGR
jgi:hypothetical protein